MCPLTDKLLLLEIQNKNTDIKEIKPEDSGFYGT